MTQYLLQVLPYSTSTDPKYLIVIGAVIGVIALARIFSVYQEKKREMIKKSDGVLGGDHSRPGVFAKNRKFKQEIKEITSICGLNQNQEDFLSRMCVSHQIEHPLQLLHSEKSLDDMFSRTLTKLQSVTPATHEIETNKTLLFLTREAISNARKNRKGITSTRSLDIGSIVTIITPKEEQYPAAILENSSRGLVCKVPRDLFENEVRLPLWSRIGLFFNTATGQSYSCTARILQYESSGNETHMVISHTDTLKSLPNRRHDRKDFSTDCNFVLVSVANVVTGKNTEHRFYPTGKPFPGTIMDISAGGCSIKTPSPPAQNQYIQIECSLDAKNADTMTGKIVRITPGEQGGDSTVHVQFAKLPRATMNRIFALIFNYGEH